MDACKDSFGEWPSELCDGGRYTHDDGNKHRFESYCIYKFIQLDLMSFEIGCQT